MLIDANTANEGSDTYSATTYRATLHGPVFYDSISSRHTGTQRILSATALMHALGYTYFGLEDHFVQRGDEATTPDYQRLADLPFFVSDSTPEVVKDVHKFLGTAYSGEFNVTTAHDNVAEKLPAGNTKSVPAQREKGSTGWHRMRDYHGLGPGSELTFTVWTPHDLPDTLRFRLGKKLTGEVVAERTESPVETVTVNRFLLEHVYGLGTDAITALFESAAEFHRGNNPRLHHFRDVDRSVFEDVALDAIRGN